MHFCALNQTFTKGHCNGYVQLYKHLLLFRQNSVNGIIWYCGTDINRVCALPVGLQSITIPRPAPRLWPFSQSDLYHWDTSTCKQMTWIPQHIWCTILILLFLHLTKLLQEIGQLCGSTFTTAIITSSSCCSVQNRPPPPLPWVAFADHPTPVLSIKWIRWG